MTTYFVQDDAGDARPGGRVIALPFGYAAFSFVGFLGERAWVKRRYPTVRQIYAGSTSQSITVFLQDSTSSTGEGKTGLAYNTSGLVCYYRKGATGTATQLALATQTAGGAYSSGGFAEVSSSNTPGLYRVDLPNSLVDAANTEVRLMIFGATGLAPYEETIQVIPSTVTVGTNNDKTGYSISGTKTTLDSLNDITAAAVWASGTRTLSEFGFTVDTNAVTLAASQPNYAPAVAGDAMTLTSGERTAVANEVEAQIIDETDSEKVLTAITDKIASVNPSLSGLTLSAIASQVRTELSTELGRIDVAVSTRLATSGYTAPVDVSANVTAIKAVTDNLADTIEDNAGTYRFTTAALSQAPSGGGGSGDWTADEKTAIRSILGIPASGTTPDNPTVGILDTIRDQTVGATIAAAVRDVSNFSPAAGSLGEKINEALVAAESAQIEATAAKDDTTEIRSKTYQLTFTTPGVVDANVDNVLKKGEQVRFTNSDGAIKDVTITDTP